MDVHQYHEIAELDASNWWYRARRALVERLMQTYVSTGGTAIDLGCGTGAHASLLRARASRVIGVDPSEDALQHASSRGYDELLQAGAESLPLPDGSAEIVLATDVLEHVDDHAVVIEIHRVLVSGGYAVITVPAFMSLWHGNDDHSHHLRRYGRGELQSLFKDNGFEVVYQGYWNRIFFPIVWIVARRYTKTSAELRNNLSSIPQWMNSIIAAWMAFENGFSRVVPLPFGVSLALIARKRVD